MIYSDGLVEAMNRGKEMFGLKRLSDLTKAHAEESSEAFVKHVVAAEESFRENAPQEDDITIVTMRYTG